MAYRNRLPTMQSSLQTLVGFGLRIDTVVDVGVFTGTGYLIDNFSTAFHHLFEPLSFHDRKIAERYKSIRHELNHLALSSEPGVAYQVGICRNGSGVTTHSFVTDRPVALGTAHGGAPVTECTRVTKATLDDHFSGRGMPAGSYLVKLDVDGHELPIILGGKKVIAGADIVIVEATVRTLIERGAAIGALGFQLFDVVDFCYYHNTLSQVDLIFANHRLLERLPDLRPWSTKRFSSDVWFLLSETLRSASDGGIPS